MCRVVRRRLVSLARGGLTDMGSALMAVPEVS